MEILLVEDDLDDAGMTIEALKQGQVRCRVSLVRDGEEAMAFLHREGSFVRAPRPDLILLDLQLPKKEGREVLTEVRNDASLARVPVVVLTSSPAHRELVEAEGLRVESYLIKPVDMGQFIDLVRKLRRFWLADVVLPKLD
jgi:chemotaxis family two-component system response regulator Rcp1